MDRDAPRICATDGVFRESALSFMTPPDAANLGALRNRGGRMIVYHGTSDPVFSSDDTQAWYDRAGARMAAMPRRSHATSRCPA